MGVHVQPDALHQAARGINGVIDGLSGTPVIGASAGLPRDAAASEVKPSVRVERHREDIRAIVERFRATSPRIVGSVARGDDRPGSDVDILVDFTHEATLLDEIGLRLALTDLLRVEVDVIASDSLRGQLRDRVMTEAVALQAALAEPA